MERLAYALKYVPKPNNPRPGFVYLIECHDFVKVGFAKDVSTRLCMLQTGCPYELRLLASFSTDNMERDEQRLHGLWKRYEVRGEWFQVPAGELACVMNATNIEEALS